MDDQEQARARIADLTAQLNRADHCYFVLDAPEISDQQYDGMLVELERLEEEHPDLRLPESPTQRVGAEPSTQFATVEHAVPFLSLTKCHSLDELIEWDRRLKRHLTKVGYEGPLR